MSSVGVPIALQETRVLAHRSDLRRRPSRVVRGERTAIDHDSRAGMDFRVFLQAHMASMPRDDHFIRTYRPHFVPTILSQRFSRIDKMSEAEHRACFKSESGTERSWQGLASIPAKSPYDWPHHENDMENSYYVGEYSASAEDSALYHHELDNIDHCSYHVPPAQGTSALKDVQSGMSTLSPLPSSVWFDMNGRTTFNRLTTMDPQAICLAAHATDSPNSDTASTKRTDAEANEFELVSDWSHASAYFEDLAASSPESSMTHAHGIVTPASSVSHDTDSGNNWATQIARGRGRNRDDTAPPTMTRWRSIDGNVTSILAVPPAANSIPTMHHSHRPQRSQVTTHYDPHTPSSSAPRIPIEMFERSKNDDYLLTMRELGLSYKEIKRRGKFREAESTLRGRVRVLTKAKEDRVRKPVWTRGDVRLLRAAVGRHYDLEAYDRPNNSAKLPWKKIAQWIHEQGSSYKFASATCAKKWDQIKR